MVVLAEQINGEVRVLIHAHHRVAEKLNELASIRNGPTYDLGAITVPLPARRNSFSHWVLLKMAAASVELCRQG